jgi:tripartite-type tricarboxylate transporter receptor subunit TctC
LPGLVVQLTCGVLGPAQTPIVAQLSDATAKVIKDPDFVRIMLAAGLDARTDASADTARTYLAAERERLVPIIKAAGLEPQ